MRAPEIFEVHEHFFVSGPRNKSGYGKDGKWHTGGERIRHSHPGGSVPHEHPHTGPSFYGYRKPKTTKRPNGEQLEFIARTEEQNTFELVITDSALISESVPVGMKVPKPAPIGDVLIDPSGFPAARTMMLGSRLKCIVRDERTHKQAGKRSAR